MNHRRTGALLLLVLVLVAYGPAFSGGFIWDDDDHLTENLYVAAPDGLRDIWSSLSASRYYPLTLTTFWVGRQLFGLKPLPYHFFNIAFHALNGLLLWQVLRRLAVRGAWVGAALWALHPVMVESVAWITELKNTQSTLFLLLALGCWLRFDETRRRRDYWFALGAFAGALASKPATVMLPVVLLLCVWWRSGRWRWPDIARTVPFWALSAGMSILTIVEQRRLVHSAAKPEWQLSLTERCALAGRAVWFYVGKLAWPMNLTFVYPRWNVRTDQLGDWLPVVAVVAVLAGLWLGRRHPWAWAGLFGTACFVGLLAPVLGFFDVYYFRYTFVADHFDYLPSMALLALAPATVMGIVRDARLRTALAVAVLARLGLLTWRQSGVYHNMQTLWEDTLVKNPVCWMAHNNLGYELARQDRSAEAIGHYQAALRIKPDFPDPHNNLGIQLDLQGRPAAAVAEYAAALKIEPTYTLARYNLAIALSRLGQTNDSMRQYEIILSFDPKNADVHYNLGLALARQGHLESAATHFAQAYQWGRSPAAAHNWALALRKLGRTNDANRVGIPKPNAD